MQISGPLLRVSCIFEWFLRRKGYVDYHGIYDRMTESQNHRITKSEFSIEIRVGLGNLIRLGFLGDPTRITHQKLGDQGLRYKLVTHKVHRMVLQAGVQTKRICTQSEVWIRNEHIGTSFRFRSKFERETKQQYRTQLLTNTVISYHKTTCNSHNSQFTFWSSP